MNGKVKNIKHGFVNGQKAIQFLLGSCHFESYRGGEPKEVTTWNKVVAIVNDNTPDLQDGFIVSVEGEWMAENNELELGGTFLFANSVELL